jgi:hypothetical protein
MVGRAVEVTDDSTAVINEVIDSPVKIIQNLQEYEVFEVAGECSAIMNRIAQSRVQDKYGGWELKLKSTLSVNFVLRLLFLDTQRYRG